MKLATGKLKARITSSLLALAMAFSLFSGVVPATVFAAEPKANDSTATPGVFTSVGPSTLGTTYYVDAEGGSDSNNGTTPATAWKTFTNPNKTTFKPGDRLLLRASSTWNDTMLYPKGNGTSSAPIVIDLYELDNEGKAVYTATSRPVINGNGTSGIGSKRTVVSGAVMIYNQEGWEFRNLEVTNSEDLSNPNAYKLAGTTQRCGILAYSDNQKKLYNHIVVKDCYVHDVQTEFFEKANDSSVGGLKAVGGIIILGHIYSPDGTHMCESDSNHRSKAGFKNVLIENNVVKRVGLEGIRTKAQGHNSSNTFLKPMENIVIRGNYLEDIAGDGIVLTEVYKGGVVENNVSIRACNADYGVKNYAGVWSMFADDALFQYNEVYGIVYGYNDGEAFDIDLSCVRNTYQYNYSHHNSGGFFLFMGDQQDSVVRYNVSANDGFGNKGTCADKLKEDGSPMFSGYNYKEQSILHYWNRPGQGNKIAKIYNNTFFVGDGVSTALYGEGNTGNNSGTISHFWNNILYKEGEGTLRLLTNQPNDGTAPTERKLGTPVGDYFKNNIIYPQSIVTEISGATIEELTAAGNIFENPQLDIIGNTALHEELNKQKSTTFNAQTDTVAAFTSTERIRERAAMFKIGENSPAIAAGIKVENAPAEDLWGNSIENKAIDIGAHQRSNFVLSTAVKEIKPVEVSTKGGYYPQLPRTVKVVYIDTVGAEQTERTEEVAVEWDLLTKEQYTVVGSYKINGTVDGIADKKAEATVNVTTDAGTGTYESYLSTKQDAFMQRVNATKAYGEDAPTLLAEKSADSKHELKTQPIKYPQKTAVGGKNVVKSKNAADPAYNRRFMVQYDLSDISEDLALISKASIQLSISRYDVWNGATGSSFDDKAKNTRGKIDVYVLDPTSELAKTWSESTATWNTFKEINDKIDLNHTSVGIISTKDSMDYKPDNLPVASTLYKNGDLMVNNNVVNVDVTDYIRSIKSEDKGLVTFVVECAVTENADQDNSGFDLFSKEGAKAIYEAYKAGSLNPGIVIESETSLAPQLYLSDLYEVSVEKTIVTTPINVAPTLPDSVNVTISDGSKKPVFVTWDPISKASYTKEGVFKVKGTSNGTGLPIEAEVTVVAKHITGFTGNDLINRYTVPFNELDLPNKITLNVKDHLDASSTLEVDVVWNFSAIAYDPATPGKYLMNGEFEMPNGVTNPDNKTLTIEVVTHPVFSVENIKVAQNETVDIKLSLAGNATDEWSSAVDYTLSAEALEAGLTLTDGKITAPANAAVGSQYVLTATSKNHTAYYKTATITVVNPWVSEVKVTPKTHTMKKNTIADFTAEVTVLNDPSTTIAKTVTWSIEGSKNAGTAITADGKLTVAGDEEVSSVVVKATSTADPTVSGTATVTLEKADSVPGNIVAPPNTITVQKGKTAQAVIANKWSFSEFSVDYADVNYSVEGNTSADTKVETAANIATVTVGADETAASFTVKATAKANSSVIHTITVNVASAETAPSVLYTAIAKAPASVQKSKTAQIDAYALLANAAADTAKGVSFELTGKTSAATTISAEGLLTIGLDETATQITVTAKAKADAAKTDSVAVKVLLMPRVSEVIVTPETAKVIKGTTHSFEAVVNTIEDEDKTVSTDVTWEVTGASSADTKIKDGVLTIGLNETAKSLTVKATSVADTTKSDTATVTVREIPVISAITIDPTETSLVKGGKKQFTAAVSTMHDDENILDKSVKWSISGNESAQTKISDTGELIVDANETASSLTVKAAAVKAESISATAVVKLINSITVAKVEGGSATVKAPENSEGGKTITVNIEAIENGKRFKDIEVIDQANNKIDLKTIVKGSEYTFTMPFSNVTVTVYVEDIEQPLPPEDPTRPYAESVKLTPDYALIETTDTKAFKLFNERDMELSNAVLWQSGDESIASVNATGTVTGVSQGSCYITATYTTPQGEQLTASALVDVLNKNTDKAPQAHLSSASVKSNIYSTTYATVMLNYYMLPDIGAKSAMSEENSSADTLESLASKYELVVLNKKGCADPETLAQYFEFKLSDDNRTIQVIPTGYNYKVAGSYKVAFGLKYAAQDSALATEVLDILTISVDKTLPKITAKPVKFNTFYKNEVLPLSLTTNVGKITSITATPEKLNPKWVTLNADGTVQIKDGETPNAKEKTLYVDVMVEGYTKPVSVSVGVSFAKTVPGLKLNLKDASFSAQKPAPVEMQLMPKNAKESFESLKVKRVSVAPEFAESYFVSGLDLTNGKFVLEILKAPEAAQTIKLLADIEGGFAPVELSIKVNPIKTLKLAASKTSVTLNTKTNADTASIAIKSSPENADISSLGSNVSVLSSAGKPIEGPAQLNVTVSADGRSAAISTNANTKAGTTYKVRLTTTEKYGSTTASSKPVSVDITVKTVAATAKITAFVTAPKLDTSKPDTAASFKATLANTSAQLKPEDFIIQAVTKSHGTVDATSWFNISLNKDGTYSIALDKASFGKGLIRPEYSYTIKVLENTAIGAEKLSKTASAKLTVTQSAAKIAQSTKSVTMYRYDKYSKAEFSLSLNGAPLPESAVVIIVNNPGNAYSLSALGNGKYALSFNGAPPTSGSVKLSIWLAGNYADPEMITTEKPNASVSVSVSLK